MDNTSNLKEEKQEAKQVMKDYLEKLIPGIRTLIEELRGNRQPDTDDFRKQCIDGINWVIEIYNRISDVIPMEKIHIAKQEFNSRLGELGAAITEKNDEKTAELLETVVLVFLKDLKEAAE